jgi:peptidoglycan DL-endopeptidase CwlO
MACALSAACASTGAGRRPVPSPGERGARAGAPSTLTPQQALGYRIAATALEFRGAPYRNGGTSPSGFDCSGLVAFVFARHGVSVPRQTASQFDVGRSVKADKLHAGDLVFFSTVAPGASHVGIALDADEFVHAPSSNGVVRVERLALPYWRSRFVGARRVH